MMGVSTNHSGQGYHQLRLAMDQEPGIHPLIPAMNRLGKDFQSN